jgi:hypothetical protein
MSPAPRRETLLPETPEEKNGRFVLRNARALAAASAAVLLVTACAACGGSKSSNGTTTGTTTQTAAKQTFCTDVSNFETSANNLKNLDPKNTTITQLTTSATNLVNDGKAVVSSGKDLAGVNAGALQSSLKGLETAVKNIPSSGSVQAGVEGVQTAANAVAQSWTTIAKNAGCKSSSY